LGLDWRVALGHRLVPNLPGLLIDRRKHLRHQEGLESLKTFDAR